MHDLEPDIVISLPLPNIDVDERELQKLFTSFDSDGRKLSIRTLDSYPVCESWAELVFTSASVFLLTTAAGHYVCKILDTFDSIVKKKIQTLNLNISANRKSVQYDISIRDRAEAEKELRRAFFELKCWVEGNVTVIYWLEDAKVTQDGTIHFISSVENGVFDESNG